jgi:hypothetical protein
MGSSAPFLAGPSLDYHFAIGQILGTTFSVYHGNNPDSVPSPSEEKFYLHARPADSIFCPFECDECSFYRLTGCPSQIDNEMHQHLLAYIRRANLDAFWSRSIHTLKGLRIHLKASGECSRMKFKLAIHWVSKYFLLQWDPFQLIMMGGCELL